jgi:histidine phosphotransferase ChpT
MIPAPAFDPRIAELLAARLCHELVSPVGAVANGVEILEDEPEFAVEAAKLIGQSARDARRRLQFYRLAYGAVGEITTGKARAVALDLFQSGKPECDWPASLQLPPGLEKLTLNLLVVAAECLPRGGTIRLAATPGGLLSVTAEGTDPRLAAPTAELLSGLPPDVEQLTARTVQAAFTGVLAARAGIRVVGRLARADAVSLTLIR